MKNKITWGAVIGVFLILIVAFAFKPTVPEYMPENIAGEGSSSVFFPKAFAADTITDAENDTLAIPFSLVSSYNWSVGIVTTRLSGTQSLQLIVQEALTTGTDWIAIDTLAIGNAAATTARITGDQVYGRKQRLILDGTGTQSVRYTINAVYKKRQ